MKELEGMKYLSLTFLSILATACATPSLFGPSQEEMDLRNAQITVDNQIEFERQKQVKEQKETTLREGVSFAQFESAFGKPNRTDFIEGVFYAHYSNRNDFMVYGFKDGKLIGWTQDLGAKTDYQIAEMRSDQEATRIRAQQAQAEADRKARIRRIFSSFGHSKTCDTHQYINGNVSTTCQ
jgi:hypothetical protein